MFCNIKQICLIEIIKCIFSLQETRFLWQNATSCIVACMQLAVLSLVACMHLACSKWLAYVDEIKKLDKLAKLCLWKKNEMTSQWWMTSLKMTPLTLQLFLQVFLHNQEYCTTNSTKKYYAIRKTTDSTGYSSILQFNSISDYFDQIDYNYQRFWSYLYLQNIT